MEEVKINENISLYYIPMTKLKTTTIGVYIHRPLCREQVSKNALLPYILKRGCKEAKDNEAIAKYLENLYGASFGAGVMKLGDDQAIYLGFETISDRYAPGGEKLTEDMTSLAMSVLFESVSFTDEILSQEKKNAIDRIMSEINDKRSYAQKRCTEIMFGSDSYALSPLGDKEGINSITAVELKDYYRSIITSSPMDIYLCGDADVKAVAEKIKSYTDKLTFNKGQYPAQTMYHGGGEVKNVTDKMEVTQGKLSLGFRAEVDIKGKESDALTVMNSIFGGGAQSKLFNNVREKLSLCYYASSSLVKNKGAMFVNAGIEFENYEKAYNEILAQLDAVKKGDISDFEFSSSVSALVNSLEGYKDDERLMTIFALSQKLSGKNLDIDTVIENIKNVTVEDVKKVAQKVELDTVYFLTGKEER